MQGTHQGLSSGSATRRAMVWEIPTWQTNEPISFIDRWTIASWWIDVRKTICYIAEGDTKSNLGSIRTPGWKVDDCCPPFHFHHTIYGRRLNIMGGFVLCMKLHICVCIPNFWNCFKHNFFPRRHLQDQRTLIMKIIWLQHMETQITL